MQCNNNEYAMYQTLQNLQNTLTMKISNAACELVQGRLDKDDVDAMAKSLKYDIDMQCTHLRRYMGET